MKFAIVLAAICFLGVAFAAPAPKAAAKPNAFAEWQKAFQDTLNNLLGQNKNKSKRDLDAAVNSAVSNLDNPAAFAQNMGNVMNQLGAIGNKGGHAEMEKAAAQAIQNAIKQNKPNLDQLGAVGQAMFKVVSQLMAEGNKGGRVGFENALKQVVNSALKQTKPKREADSEKKFVPSTNVWADAAIAMQNAWKQALENQSKIMKEEREAKSKPKRDITNEIITAVTNMDKPVVLAQSMFKIMNDLNAMGQNKTTAAAAPAAAPAGDWMGAAMGLLGKTDDPMAFATQLFKVVNTLAKDNKVVLPPGALKPKFALQNEESVMVKREEPKKQFKWVMNGRQQWIKNEEASS